MQGKVIDLCRGSLAEVTCSGAIHAKSQITVTSGNGYTISGEFSSPTVKGTWPAFW